MTTNSDCFRLCVIYRPPGISVTDFCEDFENFIDSLATKSGKLLLVGDFNIHVDSFTNLSADKFRAVLDVGGLDQLVTEATHDKSHTLDLVITRREESALVSNLAVSPLSLSDHDTLAFNLPWKGVLK